MASSESASLEDLIERLLAQPDYLDHPLHAPLERLYDRFREQQRMLEKVTRISDTSFTLVRDDALSLNERFDKQMRRLEKIAHISDRYQRILSDVNEALEKASTHDPLTGLPNRRLLGDRLRQETDRALRHGGGYTLGMLDLDHFKRVNDQHGHDAGDAILVLVSQALLSALRDYDLCGRWGGEEFLILLPQTALAEAATVIERVRQAIRAQTLPDHQTTVVITASFGLTEHRPGERPEDTVTRADTLLLTAKRNGRDRVQVG
jgi:diguanylate cyclase (GGDEF)-like protein